MEAVVVGAGVVGLAVARSLARRGRQVLVLEQAALIGSGNSSRNSEVIHSGIYYAQHSLKARLCVAGRDQLYAYCAERGVPHARCGKLIVAADASQAGELQRLQQCALANGVDNLELVSGADVRGPRFQHPALAACHSALFSPSTGIVDSHSLMLSLQGELEDLGGSVLLNTPLQAAWLPPPPSSSSSSSSSSPNNNNNNTNSDTPSSISLPPSIAPPPTDLDRMQVRVDGEWFPCELLVNAAGLGAPAVAAVMANLPAETVPEPRYAKGSYFKLSGVRPPFHTLVYPVPEPGGLGVHATIDLAGAVRFGPDVEWVGGADDFTVDEARANHFYARIRAYWPGLPDGALVGDYAGIRPKIADPRTGQIIPDFVVSGAAQHGMPNLVNLFGIESPGLTSSLALGEFVADSLRLPANCKL